MPPLIAIVPLVWSFATYGQTVERYERMCDASAAVALDARHFVVAGDEKNVLLIYERGRPKVLAQVPLDDFLRSKGDEADLEAGTRIGERIYWIGSMSRDGKGRPAPACDRFFATDIVGGSTPPTLRPVGKAPSHLRDAIISSEAGRELQLEQAAAKAPEAPGGLNIEGLTHTDDGALLIGFRNPLRAGSRGWRRRSSSASRRSRARGRRFPGAGRSRARSPGTSNSPAPRRGWSRRRRG